MTRLESVPLEGGRALEDMTVRQIARIMVEVQGLRRGKVEELKDLTVSLARAKQAATVAHAKAFLSHEGPQEERTQTAKLAAAEAVFLADAEKGKLEACRDVMDILKDDWDTCRSIGANERAQQNAAEGIGA